jgi:O-methyltransferase
VAPEPAELLERFPDLPADFVSAYAAARPYTMTSAERMYALWEAARHIKRREIAGALVECGVWRGGSAMLMGEVFHGSGRELWLYDTFSGMSAPSRDDLDFRGEPLDLDDERVIANASLDEVRRNLAFYEPVVYVQGDVEETIPGCVPDRIALLRLDTDWEASTRHELEHLYDRLSPGGVLLVDDYGHWRGARRAVDRFFAERDDAPLLTRIDYTGRIAIRV